MLPAPFNSGAVCFWSTPTDKTSAVQFTMTSNQACHCILHDNRTNMSNTNNITITQKSVKIIPKFIFIYYLNSTGNFNLYEDIFLQNSDQRAPNHRAL